MKNYRQSDIRDLSIKSYEETDESINAMVSIRMRDNKHYNGIMEIPVSDIDEDYSFQREVYGAVHNRIGEIVTRINKKIRSKA